MRGRRPRRGRSRATWLAATVVVLVSTSVFVAALLLYRSPQGTTYSGSKYVILYVNQGNGVVNESNFDSMLSFASAKGFNTVFFQVYRGGSLLFNTDELMFFVAHAQTDHIRLFFSLFLTNGTQQLPSLVYGLGENGVNLDMSTLSIPNQTSLYSSLRSGYDGMIAITTTDPTLPLSPNLLVIETYSSQIQQYAQYIHPGVVASVGVFATTSRSNYDQEYKYALQNSDGVMVFDYAGLVKSGY